MIGLSRDPEWNKQSLNKHKNTCWYSAEMEPNVGTTLYFEVSLPESKAKVLKLGEKRLFAELDSTKNPS